MKTLMDSRFDQDPVFLMASFLPLPLVSFAFSLHQSPHFFNSSITSFLLIILQE
jgi:hypothetical protein